jgi:HSP20 family protein
MTSRDSQGQLLERLGAEFDRLFGDLFAEMPGRPSTPRASGTGFPPLNVWEDEESFHVEVEVPGVSAEALDIDLAGSALTIRGERKVEAADDVTAHRRERTAGRFERTLELPAEVDADKVDASLKNGVLRLVLPKIEAVKTRRIQIRTQD